MFSRTHTYRGHAYTIERETKGWRIWHNNYLFDWKETRKEAVEQFERWVDKTTPCK